MIEETYGMLCFFGGSVSLSDIKCVEDLVNLERNITSLKTSFP